MFSSFYFLQNILLNLNLQLDKIVLLTRYVDYKFLLIIPFILISWVTNTYRSGDWQSLTYLYINILFIYFIFLARLPKLGNFSSLVSNLILIVHCLTIIYEGAEGRAHGLLGVNGAFVFLIFSLSQQNDRKKLFFLFLVSLVIAYFTASRSTFLLSLGILIYLSFKTDLPRIGQAIVKMCTLLFFGLTIYITIDYVHTTMLRGISFELILEVINLDYEEIVDKYSKTPAISDLDRLSSLKVFLRSFDLTCLFGCYWEHTRPLHNSLLELIFYTGILGFVTVFVLLTQLYKLTKRCLPSGVLMSCASIALITGPIQFFPIYYYSLKMLMTKLKKKEGLK